MLISRRVFNVVTSVSLLGPCDRFKHYGGGAGYSTCCNWSRLCSICLNFRLECLILWFHDIKICPQSIKGLDVMKKFIVVIVYYTFVTIASLQIVKRCVLFNL